MNLAVILDTVQSLFKAWDSEKCPVAKAYFKRMKEANMWLDMNLAVILDTVQSLFKAWDSEKCPVAKAYFKRMEEARIDEGSNSGCKEVRSEFNDCRKEA